MFNFKKALLLSLILLAIPVIIYAQNIYITGGATTDIYLSGPGLTYTLQASSSATSVSVTTTSFTVVTGSGESVTIYHSSGKHMENDQGLTPTCGTGGVSTLVVPQNKTVIFTPLNTTLCTSTPVSGGGSGGGGISGTPTTPVTPVLTPEEKKKQEEETIKAKLKTLCKQKSQWATWDETSGSCTVQGQTNPIKDPTQLQNVIQELVDREALRTLCKGNSKWAQWDETLGCTVQGQTSPITNPGQLRGLINALEQKFVDVSKDTYGDLTKKYTRGGIVPDGIAAADAIYQIAKLMVEKKTYAWPRNNKFLPKNPITAYPAIQMALVVAGSDCGGRGISFKKCLAAAKDKGIVAADVKYKTNTQLKRVEFYAMMLKAAKQPLVTTSKYRCTGIQVSSEDAAIIYTAGRTLRIAWKDKVKIKGKSVNWTCNPKGGLRKFQAAVIASGTLEAIK